MERLARVSDVNSECPSGELPLYLAVMGGDINVIEALTDADADASALHSDGNPLLYHAISAGYLEVLYLTRGGADVNAKDVDGNPLLYHAVIRGDINQIEAFTDAGADASAKDVDGNPLLYHAILLPSGYNAVRYLIRGGADVNAVDAQGNTLLSTAAEKNDINILDALIDAGAGQAPICNAIASGDIEKVRQLIGADADLNTDCGGYLLLHKAIRERELEIMRFLIEAGADVNARDSSGHPPLYRAFGEPEIVQILIEAGADVNARDGWGDPLLNTPVAWGYPDTVRLLLDAGADVNAKNDDGTSLANLAYEEEELEILQMLLDAGAEADFPPQVPSIRVIDRSESSLTIRVFGSLGVETYYAVRRRDAAASEEWEDLEVHDTDGVFEDQGLNPDSTYYYELQACNAAGCSELSPETGGVTESSGQVEPPVAPVLNAETRVVSALLVWNTFIDLSWEAVDGATYYEVYQGDRLDSQLSAPQTMWSSSDHDASYRVKACNKAGCSPPSNTSSSPE